MANDGKFLNLTGGIPTQETGVTTATANAIPRLLPTGKFDPTLMPEGVVAEVIAVQATEAIAAGAWVNLYNSTGLRVRNADATTVGKEAHGFVIAAIASGATGNVYLEGLNTGVSGRTPGARQFLATTAGAGTETAPATSGNVAQVIGVATSATAVSFAPQLPITLA